MQVDTVFKFLFLGEGLPVLLAFIGIIFILALEEVPMSRIEIFFSFFVAPYVY